MAWFVRFPKSARALEGVRGAATRLLIHGDFKSSGEAFEKMGFRSEHLGNPGGDYHAPIRGMFGVIHTDWIVSFANKSASAARWPTLAVHVNDRTGKTDVVEADAHP